MRCDIKVLGASLPRYRNVWDPRGLAALSRTALPVQARPGNHGDQLLYLTPPQIAAAMAVGIRFTPATPEQVQRLSMQRRVFRIDEAPHLATRDGSFFETAATLQRLIAAHQADEAPQQADLAIWE